MNVDQIFSMTGSVPYTINALNLASRKRGTWAFQMDKGKSDIKPIISQYTGPVSASASASDPAPGTGPAPKLSPRPSPISSPSPSPSHGPSPSPRISTSPSPSHTPNPSSNTNTQPQPHPLAQPTTPAPALAPAVNCTFATGHLMGGVLHVDGQLCCHWLIVL